jgi:hypothetical protein
MPELWRAADGGDLVGRHGEQAVLALPCMRNQDSSRGRRIELAWKLWDASYSIGRLMLSGNPRTPVSVMPAFPTAVVKG